MFKVYWTSETGEACFQNFEDMTVALNWTQFVREKGRTFVTMVSENPNCTSKLGVDEVKDTKNYDGWVSRKSNFS